MGIQLRLRCFVIGLILQKCYCYSTATAIDCTKFLALDNKTCIIDKDQVAVALIFDWDGDLVIDEGVKVQAYNEIRINATGEVTLRAGVQVTSEFRHIKILGRSVHILSNVRVSTSGSDTAESDVAIGGENCIGEVSIIDGATIYGSSVDINCQPGSVLINCASRCEISTEGMGYPNQCDFKGYYLTTLIDQYGINISATNIHVSSRNASLATDYLLISAEHDMVIAGSLQQAKVLNTEQGDEKPTQPSCAFLLAGGRLDVGFKNGKWTMRRFAAVADRMSVAEGHYIESVQVDQNDNVISKCNEHTVHNEDQCSRSFSEWSGHSPQDWFEVVAQMDNNAAVFFDLLLAAKHNFSLGANTQLRAAAVLLCSTGNTFIKNHAYVGTKGRGCSAGDGPRGSTYGRWCRRSGKCGAGGGHLEGIGSAGGVGAYYRYDTSRSISVLEACCDRWTKKSTFRYSELPTRSASGGECDFKRLSKSKLCQKNPNLASRGGGLIWISAGRLELEPGVNLVSDGSAGDLFLVPSRDTFEGAASYIASGGGAGGQIVVFTRIFVVVSSNMANAEVPFLSAQGGDGVCYVEQKSVSGGGGGGFIGLMVKRYFECARPEQLQEQVPGTCSPSLSQADLRVDVSGGQLPKCERLIRPNTSGLEDVRGETGLATSLSQCPPGDGGALCMPCELGKWNDGTSKECLPCQNKPGKFARYTSARWTNRTCPYECLEVVDNISVNPECRCFAGRYGSNCTECGLGEYSYNDSDNCSKCRNKPEPWSVYTTPAWHNDACPYECIGGVPDTEINSECRTLAAYFIWQAGGETLLLKTFIFFASIAMLLFMYSCVSANKGVFQHRKRRGSVSRARDTDNKKSGGFAHENLPYHLCRIFLNGGNTHGNPWILHDVLPPSMEELILPDQWQDFIVQFNKRADVPFIESAWANMMMVLYLPASPLFCSWSRRSRARSLQLLVAAASKGVCAAVWGPREERRSRSRRSAQTRRTITGAERLEMRLCFDPGATLGYIDFFDFSASLYDWKPIDLRMEARVLVAQGHGSYNEPYKLDVSDPLVEQVAQAGFGARNVYSVVFAFNRNALFVPSEELLHTGEEPGNEFLQQPMLERLRCRVEACAERCGLGGVAQVQVLHQRRPSVKVEAKNKKKTEEVEKSFAELVQELKDEASNEPTDEGAGLQDFDLKLCLTFMDRQRTSGLDWPLRKLSRKAYEAPIMPLASPMSHLHLLRHAQTPSSTTTAASSSNLVLKTALKNAKRVLSCSVLDVSSPNLAAISVVVTMLTLVLLLTDAVLGLLLGKVLYQVNPHAFIAWIIVLPCANFFEVITGVFFVVSECPRTGRICAALEILSITSMLPSSFFGNHLLKLTPLIGLLKLFLYCLLQLYIRIIETRNDERSSFTVVQETGLVQPPITRRSQVWWRLSAWFPNGKDVRLSTQESRNGIGTELSEMKGPYDMKTMSGPNEQI